MKIIGVSVFGYAFWMMQVAIIRQHSAKLKLNVGELGTKVVTYFEIKSGKRSDVRNSF